MSKEPNKNDLEIVPNEYEDRDYEVNVGELTIPHPRMFSRAFVLAPLADLAPCLEDPVTKLTVRQTLVDLGNGPETIRRRDMSEST